MRVVKRPKGGNNFLIFFRPTLFIFLINLEQLQDIIITIYVSLHCNTILVNQLNSIKHASLNRSPNSTRDCFKYLRSSIRKRLPSQMQWKDKKATNSLGIANLMNDYFSSVFLSRWNSALYAHDNTSILLNMLLISVLQVETSLASASTTQ